MEGFTRSRDCRSLLAALGVTAIARSEPIHIWRLSGVERLQLPNRSTVVFKYAVAPFTDEHLVLIALAEQGVRVPVPHLKAARVQNGMLGMLLDDLGKPIRDATTQDAAEAAVSLHAADPPMWLERLGEADLAALPRSALTCLDELQQVGRYPNTQDLRERLTELDRFATKRAEGTHRPPYGLCHGDLHPSDVHISTSGLRILDFAMTFIGPGLLDLAAWSGLRRPPNPPVTRQLIELYVRAGGHPGALADRGGLPAERWALGWHRLQAAHWLLNCGASGIDGPETDDRHITILRRQLASAHDLLATSVTPPPTTRSPS